MGITTVEYECKKTIRSGIENMQLSEPDFECVVLDLSLKNLLDRFL